MRKLIEYLPSVVRDYAEFQGITGSEQPEFEQAWISSDDLLDNQFIFTAGNMGLSRWEAVLGIVPRATDTLDGRRVQIKTRLTQYPPYTYRAFAAQVEQLADGEPYTLQLQPMAYQLEIQAEWTGNGKAAALDWLLAAWIPCNLSIDARNNISTTTTGQLVCGGLVTETLHLIIGMEGA